MLLLRLRCYLPSTSAIIAILAVAYLILHAATGPRFAGFSLATDIVIAVGLSGLAAGTIVISAVTIRRRRAAAGACHTCSHPCRGAMLPLPERDAQLWPHRPLTHLPGGLPLNRQPLPLTVISTAPDTVLADTVLADTVLADTVPAARPAERVRA